MRGGQEAQWLRPKIAFSRASAAGRMAFTGRVLPECGLLAQTCQTIMPAAQTVPGSSRLPELFVIWLCRAPWYPVSAPWQNNQFSSRYCPASFVLPVATPAVAGVVKPITKNAWPQKHQYLPTTNPISALLCHEHLPAVFRCCGLYARGWPCHPITVNSSEVGSRRK